MKWARTFLAIGYTTDHANITRMLPDLQRPCKRSALHACKQPQIQRKAKRADVREKRSNPKRGKRKGKSCDIEHPSERKCADDHRKERERDQGRKSCNFEHPLTKPLKPVVLAVVLLEKVSVRMKCARPTLSSRHTRFRGVVVRVQEEKNREKKRRGKGTRKIEHALAKTVEM